jgi:hypothetical protein
LYSSRNRLCRSDIMVAPSASEFVNETPRQKRRECAY